MNLEIGQERETPSRWFSCKSGLGVDQVARASPAQFHMCFSHSGLDSLTVHQLWFPKHSVKHCVLCCSFLHIWGLRGWADVMHFSVDITYVCDD